jgi:hypothetical protein
MLSDIKVYFYEKKTIIIVFIFIGFFLGLAIGYSSIQPLPTKEINYDKNSKD